MRLTLRRELERPCVLLSLLRSPSVIANYGCQTQPLHAPLAHVCSSLSTKLSSIALIACVENLSLFEAFVTYLPPSGYTENTHVAKDHVLSAVARKGKIALCTHVATTAAAATATAAKLVTFLSV